RFQTEIGAAQARAPAGRVAERTPISSLRAALRAAHCKNAAMTLLNHVPVGNGLLARLAQDDLALLRPHLRDVSLFPCDLLHQPAEKIVQVYFLQSGIVSLMALDGGASVETVSMGCEGAIGTIEGFGSLHAFTAARVQVGGSALRMPGPVFRRT